MTARIANALTVAGSDSGGGAGVQADLKTMSALGVYGCSVVTALTAQSTRGVSGIHEVPSAFVRAQLDTVFEDIRIDATKVGMLASADIVEVVADGLVAHGARNIVIDPVMVAKSGDRLLRPDAVSALLARLIPLARVLTPNLPEVGDLLGSGEPTTRAEMVDAGLLLRSLGPEWVLVKGGHRLAETSSADVLIGPEGTLWLEAPRTRTRNTHGTGCTLSSAIAAELAKGRLVPEAVRRAKDYLTAAIAAADRLEVGSGHGPVHHFHAHWASEEELTPS